MCRVCGCSDAAGGSVPAGQPLQPVRTHAAELDTARMVKIEQEILGKNDRYAQHNRSLLAEQGIFCVNLMSGPGAGKTSLLVKTLNDLKAEIKFTVIEGDQETSRDADRIRATGVAAVQLNTGKGCHLDAHMVGHGIESLAPLPNSTLLIENVGNLVCPAGFDLGEQHRVAILSVTEGDDKPLKYPDMFAFADLLLLNKIDLLPYVEFDVEQCIENVRRINPAIVVMQVSATTGSGMEQWYDWLRTHQHAATDERN